MVFQKACTRNFTFLSLHQRGNLCTAVSSSPDLPANQVGRFICWLRRRGWRLWEVLSFL